MSRDYYKGRVKGCEQRQDTRPIRGAVKLNEMMAVTYLAVSFQEVSIQ